MHGFAILAFGGLVVAVATRLMSAYGREVAKAGNWVMYFGLGVGYAYLADFSIFGAWGMSVRSHTYGAIITGFMVGGFAWLWEEAIGYFHAYAHRGNGEASKRLRRAA